MQIEIDFDVFKALTARRRDENHTHNDVIREMLGLAEASERSLNSPPAEAAQKRDFQSRDLTLPHGTRLRAVYKGKTYTAAIDDGRWIDAAGQEYGSPSAAAKAITRNSVNGLRFWHAKRPNDHDWWTLEVLVLVG